MSAGGELRRPDPEEEERKRIARSEVASAVHSGDRLSVFSDSDLDWAFSDHREHLAELRALDQARDTPTRDPRWRELKGETERVLREWDAKEQAERRERARAEAIRRLGLAE